MLRYAPSLQQDDHKPVASVPYLAEQFATGRLTWWPEIGIGYYPVEAGLEPYNRTYFERYRAQAEMDIGRALMKARFHFVERHYTGTLVDVGIGSGAFVELRNQNARMTYGYDVNPFGVRWLAERKLFLDPYAVLVDAMEAVSSGVSSGVAITVLVVAWRRCTTH